jgi:hypothetical protein
LIIMLSGGRDNGRAVETVPSLGHQSTARLKPKIVVFPGSPLDGPKLCALNRACCSSRDSVARKGLRPSPNPVGKILPGFHCGGRTTSRLIAPGHRSG